MKAAMKEYAYLARLAPAREGGFDITFPALPDALTDAADRGEAAARAADCLAEALAARIADGEAIPAPHGGAVPRGHILVRAGLDLAYKLALWEAMRGTGTTRVALASRLGLDEKEVRRVLDPAAKVKVPRLEAALRARRQADPRAVRPAALGVTTRSYE